MMRTTAARWVVATCALALVGCGASSSAARAVPAAFDDMARVLGTSADDVPLNSSTLEDLGRSADVPVGALQDVVSQPRPPTLVERAREALEGTITGPGAEIARSTALSLACDYVLDGAPITTDDVQVALGEAAGGQFSPRAEQTMDAVEQLVADMEAAWASPDPDRRASVLLLCFVFDQTG